MRRWSVRLVVPAVLLAASPEGSALAARTGEIARLVEMRLRDGASAAFEAGYRKHLEWHRQAGDPWAWHGWFVATGDRAGTFVDGTFGHSWAELDTAVKPAEDSADNAINVFPHVMLILNAHLVRLPDQSRGEESEALNSAMLTTLRIRLSPGSEATFWSAAGKSLGKLPIQCYRLTGGPT